MKKRKWWVIILLVIILIFAIKILSNEDDWICVNGEWIKHGSPKAEKPKGYCIDGVVDNFKECIAVGNPVMESYPRQCIHDNQTFKEIIENFCIQEEISDLCITLYDPVCGYPSNKTFTNSCFACQDKEVIYWIPGVCL